MAVYIITTATSVTWHIAMSYGFCFCLCYRVAHSVLYSMRHAQISNLAPSSRRARATPASFMSKYWCFTKNFGGITDPSDIDMLARKLGDIPDATFLSYQLERGAQGTLHFQGYLEFGRKKRRSTVARIEWPEDVTALGVGPFSNCYLASRKGSAAQAFAYSVKDDTRLADFEPIILGSISLPAQGKRNDLDTIKEYLDDGGDMTGVADNHFSSYVRYHRGLEKAQALLQHTKRDPFGPFPNVLVLVGPPGCGKTRFAYEYGKSVDQAVYAKPTGKWFHYYNQEPVCLIDEMYGSRMSHGELLTLLDRYPMAVESKGSYVQFNSPTIILTSNVHPSEWYTVGGPWDRSNALFRRLVMEPTSLLVMFKGVEPPMTSVMRKYEELSPSHLFAGFVSLLAPDASSRYEVVGNAFERLIQTATHIGCDSHMGMGAARSHNFRPPSCEQPSQKRVCLDLVDDSEEVIPRTLIRSGDPQDPTGQFHCLASLFAELDSSSCEEFEEEDIDSDLSKGKSEEDE